MLLGLLVLLGMPVDDCCWCGCCLLLFWLAYVRFVGVPVSALIEVCRVCCCVFGVVAVVRWLLRCVENCVVCCGSLMAVLLLCCVHGGNRAVRCGCCSASLFSVLLLVCGDVVVIGVVCCCW